VVGEVDVLRAELARALERLAAHLEILAKWQAVAGRDAEESRLRAQRARESAERLRAGVPSGGV
jgi:hypothetical protein